MTVRRAAFLFALLATGCAASPALRAAREGDRARLSAAIADAQAHGGPSDAEARRLAVAVATRELAGGAAEVAATLDALAPCLADASEAIEARAKGDDDGAAIATLALVDAAPRGRSHVRRYAAAAGHAHAGSAAWRAAAVRVGDEPEGRRAATLDLDERVRTAALRAAADAADPEDRPWLLDALARDPSAAARVAAAEALGASADAATVMALAERWSGASDDVRRGIVRALSTPAARDAGGARELARLVESARGRAAVDAALSLIGAGDAGAGGAALARLVRDGSHEERLAAIASAPLHVPAVRDAVRDAAASSDPAIAAAALAREASLPAERAGALARLAGLAAGGAQGAVLGLAAAHDERAAPALDAWSASARPAERADAARGRALLAPGRAAGALADADRSVRLVAVCAILAPRGAK